MLFVPKIHSELQFLTISNHLVDKFSKDLTQVDHLHQIYAALANHLSQNQLIIISERIFGSLAYNQTINAVRHQHYQARNIQTVNQPTYVEGKSPYNQPFSGVQLIAIATNGNQDIQWLKKNSKVQGVYFQGADAEYVLLTDLARALSPSQPPSLQTVHSLQTAYEILTNLNWSYKDVRRTWFYLDSILNWYDEFNTARNQLYQSFGLLNGKPLDSIPASTGIEGKNALGHACTFDLLAMREREGCRLNIKQLRNPKQNEATDYGSAFSRALSIQTKLNTYLFISGTASIDEQGNTIHPNDPEKQIRRTFENIASLLAASQTGFESIVQATAFCKESDYFEIYEEIAQDYGLNPETVIRTVADVCRDDLLFELDATALIDQHL